MTYFLNQSPTMPQNPMVPDIAPTAMLEGIGAAFQKSALENDANFRVSREKSVEYRDMSLSAGNRIGVETIYQEGVKRGLFKSAAAGNRAPPTTVEEALAQDWRAGKLVLDLAREQAQANPETWSDLDLSDDGVDARVNERLQAEHRDLTQTLGAMPQGRTMAELVGGIGGMTLDAKNVPFLFLGGGGGSLVKVFAREALANTLAEGVNLPSQFSMAERLEIPDPDVLTQLSLAAIGGGVLGVAAEGFARGVTYFMGRNRVVSPPNMSPSRYETIMEVAEDAVVRGENPLDAVTRVLNDLPFDDPRTFPEPREPLIPRSVTATTPEPTPLAPDPVTTQTLPPREGEAPRSDNELAALAETAINDADAMRRGAVGSKRFPFLQALKKAGVRINPDSPEGQELRNMGITARTMPGLFSRKAAGERTALDTLVASEWDETFPGLWDATRTPRDTSGSGGLYLDRDGVFDVIRREQAGDLNWIRAIDDANRLESGADAALRGERPQVTTEIEDFTSGVRADGGFYMEPPNPFDGGADEWRDRMIEARRGVGDMVFRYQIRDLPAEDMDEIVRELAEYGGDAKFLIERAIYREIDEIKRGVEAPDGTARATDGQDRGGEQPPSEPAPDGAGPGAAGGGAGEPQGTERTAAGIQYVAPGIAPVTDRARLEAQQSRPMRGGSRAMDEGLFDTASRAQMDMFSEPTGPKARPMQDAMMEDLRDTIDGDGDFTVDLMDGRGERPASSLLNELEQDDEFMAVLDACGRPRSE